MYFIHGLTSIAEAIATYQAIKAMETSGAVIVSWSNQGTTVTKQVYSKDPDSDCRDIERFLQREDPIRFKKLIKTQDKPYYV